MQRSVLLAVVVFGVSSALFAQQDKKEAAAKESEKAAAQSKEKGKEKGKGAADDAITMTVITKTGALNKNARADGIKVFVLLNGDADHKTRLQNPRKNNFELGATDTFSKLPVKMPLNEIESIRLTVEGDDMWKCETISVQFSQNDLRSKLYKFSPGRYLSAGKEKKGYNATKTLDFKLNPSPKLAAPDKTDDADDSERPPKKGDKDGKPEKAENKSKK